MTRKEAIDKLEHLINSPVGREEIDETCFEVMKYLAEQEPRVMTLDEAKSVEGYAWLECFDTPILRVSLFHDGYYIEPFEEPFRADLMNWPDYNKQWRYWTSCPTDEQREKEPWIEQA
jgi:hypothetical protein